MDTPELRTTETKSANATKPTPRRFDLTRLLTQRDRLPWFWFFFTVAVLLLSAMDRYHIVSQFKQRERVVIIDPAGTYYLSPLLQFSEAKDLHVQQAELATMAFLERNPKDFDNPDLLKLMFLKSALAKAQDERVKEMVEFRAKQLHQKAEIGQHRHSGHARQRGAGRRHRPDHPQRHLSRQGVHRGVSVHAPAPPHPQPQHGLERTLPHRRGRLQI